MIWLAWLSLFFAGSISSTFLFNLFFFRKSPIAVTDHPLEVSVLIPARNESMRIGNLIDSVIASKEVIWEICVLDDESDDDTAEMVEAYSARYPQIRLLRGGKKPIGWSGKQYACWQLAEHAYHQELVFLDADVTLTPDALARAVSLRKRIGVDLLSGFPRQRVVTIGERLLIPLIHEILLCFLPFVLMRHSKMVGAAAGCGQFFLTTKSAYQASGGHGAIRQSLHDGIMLPRAYRLANLKTDLFDASDIAECRMYTSFAETWTGLLKNAGEGFAKMPLLVIISALMFLAFILPLLLSLAIIGGVMDQNAKYIALTSLVLGYLPRIICCILYDRSWVISFLHPISIIFFLSIQWIAWIQQRMGKTVNWRSRSYEMAAP